MNNDQRSLAAEKAFRARMAALGATVLGNYVNNKTTVEAICVKGHRVHVWPGAVLAGRGPCRQCGGGRGPVPAQR